MLFPTLLPLLALLPITLSAPAPAPAPSLEKRYTSVLIYSSRRPSLCLSTDFIRGPRPGIGVTLVDCSTAILWDISPGAGVVRVTGNDLVLDASYNPGNGGLLTVSDSLGLRRCDGGRRSDRAEKEGSSMDQEGIAHDIYRWNSNSKARCLRSESNSARRAAQLTLQLVLDR